MYKKNILSSLVLQVWKILFRLVFSVLVARVVGTATYGQITYFFLIFNLISSYGHLGIINGISYFAKNDKTELSVQFNSNIFYLVGNWGLLLILLGIPYVKNFLLPEYSYGWFLLGMIYVLACYIQMALEAYYIFRERLYQSNRYWIIGMSISMLGMLGCFFAGKISFFTYTILQIFEIAIVAVLLYVSSELSLKFRFNKQFIWEELKYGNIIFWATLFGYLNYRIDQIMIKNQIGDEMLGIYSVAVTLAELVLLIPNSITAALTGKLLNIEKDEEKTKIVLLTLKLCIYICVLLVFLGYVMSPLIVVMYGKEYSSAIEAFMILLVGVCGAAVAKVIYPYFLTNGQTKVHLLVTGLSMVINAVMNVFFIAKYGINGAAFASTISYFFYGGVYVILYKQKRKIKLSEMLLLSKDEIGLLKSNLYRGGKF